jgi:hypothetical protein
MSSHPGSQIARGLAQAPVSSKKPSTSRMRWVVEDLVEKSGAAIDKEVLAARVEVEGPKEAVYSIL